MQRKYSQFRFTLVLGVGTLLALVLCVQCVRTYLYTGTVLVPQQAEHEAARQAGALSAATRSAGITDPRALGPVVEHTLEAASDRVLWMRVLDLNSNVLVEGGNAEGTPKIPDRWWRRVERRESVGTVADTRTGKAMVVLLPLRMPRPPNSAQNDLRHAGYALELAISLKAVSGTFTGLRENLIVGVIASLALLMSVAVIGLRAPHYFRGKYLESELQLAKRVQNNLQPKPQSVSAHVEFAVCAIAADHVGGDFYDIFEAEPDKVAIVLGDASGKGMPAALLVSVLQGAIRSSTAPEHEFACERINRMLCEQTSCERFATLFWGVYDARNNTLRYVNAGHAAPLLSRRDGERMERLSEGGPVLGLLPGALYSAGTVKIEAGDKLVVYSDGVIEAANEREEEFGEARIAEIISKGSIEEPEALCERIVKQVTAFAGPGAAQDDRTLVVVKLSHAVRDTCERQSDDIALAAVA